MSRDDSKDVCSTMCPSGLSEGIFTSIVVVARGYAIESEKKGPSQSGRIAFVRSSCDPSLEG